MNCQHLLVIGYGNTLRRDDGVGVKVAEAIAEMDLPGVQTINRHQLVPELAEPVSRAGAVIFVDADVTVKGEPTLNLIQPAPNAQILAHAVDPRSLLALAKQMFGHSPQAWTLSIPVKDMGFGDELSRLATNGRGAAVKLILNLLQKPVSARQ